MMNGRTQMLQELSAMIAADKKKRALVRIVSEKLYDRLTELGWDEYDMSAALQLELPPAPVGFAEAVLDSLYCRVGYKRKITGDITFWLDCGGSGLLYQVSPDWRRHCDFFGADGLPIPEKQVPRPERAETARILSEALQPEDVSRLAENGHFTD